jgi:hypothetical protein
MISLPSNFPRRIRIRGGEFGASARAMHRKAALENVSRATIERKTMSTKTTFKRVALVAVAALGIGMLSAVPSNAAPSVAYTTMYDNVNGYQVVGGQATITLTNDTSTSSAATNGNSTVTLSGVGSLVSSTPSGGTAATQTPTTVPAGSTSWSVYGGTGALPTYAIVLTSQVAGTQTITVTPLAANGSPGTAVTKSITWLASTTTSVSASNSTSILAKGTGAPTTSGTDDTVAAASTSGVQVANALVTLKDGNNVALGGQTLSATVSGPGLIAWGTTAATAGTVRASSVTLGTGSGVGNTSEYLGISSDGTAGVSTITITDGTTTIATETVTFSGSAATYVATNAFTNYAIGANGTNGSSTAYALKVKVTDANGNIVADGTTVYATSSDTTLATVSASQTTVSGYAYFAVTGVAAGSPVITFGNAASSATVTTTATVKVTSSVASTVTLAFDKTSYAPGEKMILTLTANNAAGAGIADSATYTGFLATGGLSSNVALQGSTITGTAPSFVGGVATFTVYAPLTSGTVTVTGTTGTSANLATAAQGLALTVSADIVDSNTSAAVDAANAATDAANYAADAADAATTAAQEATAAAQAAQDSADAATAAVVALGLRVNVLMASVRAQLTSLSNLLVRIIKKTHA